MRMRSFADAVLGCGWLAGAQCGWDPVGVFVRTEVSVDGDARDVRTKALIAHQIMHLLQRPQTRRNRAVARRHILHLP